MRLLPPRLPLLLFAAVGCSSPAVSQDKPAAVNAAIRRGADYLERIHAQGGGVGSHPVGEAALAGIALLESGARRDSPALTNIIRQVREQALSQTQTYELGLTAMFLDRLGDPADIATIQFVGIRLLDGQGPTGGWTYSCGNALPLVEERRLRTRFAGGAEEPAAPAAPPKKVDPNKPVPVEKPQPVAKPKESAKSESAETALHPENRKLLRLINPRGNPAATDGDNSNTQFAIVGLWCARRAGLNADRALKLTEARFRRSQSGDGGWSYTPHENSSTPSMTCAGLMGIALGDGINPNRAATLRTEDAPVPVGKAAVGNNAKDRVKDPALLRGLTCLNLAVERGQRGDSNPLADNYYFLWSLERVGMALGVETIGQFDWYRWGSGVLLRSQNADGSWAAGSYPGARGEVSTCFALLFLNRTNLTGELTKSLKSKPDFGEKPASAAKPATGNGGPVAVGESSKPVPVPPKPDDAGFDREADCLCQKLLKAAPESRATVLAELRDTKGPTYTEALVRAAAQGPASLLSDIREALAQRLKRMTRATLREMLKDPNREVRRAAAKAAGLKADAELAADLIEVLMDSEAIVVQAAHSSLVSLSGGKDFGPADGAGVEERRQAAEAWRGWKR